MSPFPVAHLIHDKLPALSSAGGGGPEGSPAVAGLSARHISVDPVPGVVTDRQVHCLAYSQDQHDAPVSLLQAHWPLAVGRGRDAREAEGEEGQEDQE